jgi:hypothetical protein
MSPWEAVEFRYSRDESDFRADGEERHLLAFWIEGNEIGASSAHGVDIHGAGGIDGLIGFNEQFLRAVLKAALQNRLQVLDCKNLLPTVEYVVERVEEAREEYSDDDEHSAANESGCEEDFADELSDRWQVETIGFMLSFVFDDVPGVDVSADEAVGGAYLCESSWTEVFVWADDKVAAETLIAEQVSKLREIVERCAALASSPRS